MDDHGFSKDLAHREPVGEEDGKGEAVIAEKRRQITGMIGMLAVVGIIMHQRVGKWVVLIARARAAAVDMKGKNPVCAGVIRCRKSGDLCGYEHTGGGLMKGDFSADIRIVCAALYFGDSGGRLAENACEMVHLFKEMAVLSCHAITPCSTILFLRQRIVLSGARMGKNEIGQTKA